MAMSGQTDFLKLGTYMSGDKLSYLGGFNTNMQKIDTFAEDTATTLSQLNSGGEQTKQALQSLNNRIGSAEVEIASIDSNVSNLRQGQNIHTTSIRNLQSGQESLENDITSLRTEDDSLDARVTALEDSGQVIANQSCKAFANVPSSISAYRITFPDIGITSENENNFNLFYTVYASFTRTVGNNTMIVNGLVASGVKPLAIGSNNIVDANTQIILPVSYLGAAEQAQSIYTLNMLKALEISSFNTQSRYVNVLANANVYYTNLLYGADKEDATFGGISASPISPTFKFELTIFKKA